MYLDSVAPLIAKRERFIGVADILIDSGIQDFRELQKAIIR
jgi:hypothetical protein